METSIPFAGYYASWHQDKVNSAIETYFSNDQGDLLPDLWEKIDLDFKMLHQAYNNEFVESFSNYLKIPSLRYLNMKSPKEYNFTTDRIFCEVSAEDILMMFEKTDKGILEQIIKDTFTSYSGFISFYDSSLDKWKDNVLEWDCNELETLIRAYIKTNFEHYEEYEVVDNAYELIVNNVLEDATKNWDEMIKELDIFRGDKNGQ